jgi:hypothetical protein
VILDAIDGAIADYAVSGDAMRWTDSPLVDRFELVIEAVRTDGARVRLDLTGNFRMSPYCVICGRPVVAPNGDVNISLCLKDGDPALRCQLPQGCPGRAAA